MANLDPANVTVIDSWTTGGTNGKRNVVKYVKWTSTTAGGGTNRLLATAFGFTKLIRCSNILLDATTKKLTPAVVSADGSEVLTAALTQGTDANRSDAADLATSTDYAYATLEGIH